MFRKTKGRTRRFLNKLAYYNALGFPKSQIAIELNKEFNMNMKGSTVSNIIKKEAVYRKQLIQTDEEVRALYKETLPDLIKIGKSNLVILQEMRDSLIERFDDLKQDISETKLFNFIREINNSVKTQNDSIRTLNETLGKLQTETKELKISTVQTVQETAEILKNLEDLGFIKIQPEYYRSGIYSQIKKKKKEEEIEEQNGT